MHFRLRLELVETFCGASITPIGLLKLFTGNHGDIIISLVLGTLAGRFFLYFHKHANSGAQMGENDKFRCKFLPVLHWYCKY